METQERALLDRFLAELQHARVQHKDAEADALISAACSRQPDAAYLLVQRALQLEQALAITQTKLDRVAGELQQSRAAGSGFLDSNNAWGRSAQPSPATTSPTGVRVDPAAPATAAGVRSAPEAPRGSGLWGNVAATAAGVVAGSFLFQGVQSLLGRHGTDAAWGATTPAQDMHNAAALSGDAFEPQFEQDRDAADETIDTASYDTDSGDVT